MASLALAALPQPPPQTRDLMLKHRARIQPLIPTTLRQSRRCAVALTAVVLLGVLSCAAGPPHTPPSGALGPSSFGAPSPSRAGFSVVFAGPRGRVADRAQPAVTVLFNRAMRDPDAADDANLPAVTIAADGTKPVLGAWRWVGTHGMMFAPEGLLLGGTRYAVTVPQGVRSLDGEVLPAPYTFDFHTDAPSVIESLPREGSTVKPGSSFTLVFNQRMDPASVEKGVQLLVRSGPSDAGRPVPFRATRAARPKDAVVLSPASPLPLDSAIDVTVDKGLAGEGAIKTKAARTLSFHTYGPLRLTDIRCPRATGPRCQAHRDFTIVLSNPVAAEEFAAHFKVPGLPRHKPASAERSKRPQAPSREQLVLADPDFGKRYHAVLTAGMRDDLGQALEHDVPFDIDTEAPFVLGGHVYEKPKGTEPVASSPPADGADDTSGNGAGGTPLDATHPHRPELDYNVRVGLSGNVFEALAKTGVKSHQIPVGAVNIPTYAMAAAKIRAQDVLAWIARADGAATSTWPWTWVTPGAPENVRDVRTIDVDALLGGPNARGAALIAAATPGSMQSPDAHIVSVTDLAVTAELSRYGSLVWVTRLSTGAPVPDATLSVEKLGKPALFSTTTNADGVAIIPADQWTPVREGGEPDGQAYFIVKAGDDWTFDQVSRAAASYRSGVNVDLAQRGQWAGMVYTDRGVYRPGETLKLSGVFRKADAAGLSVVNTDARVAFEDADGEKVFDGRADLDAYGELNMEIPLAKTSHLGEGRVHVQIGRASGDSFEQPVLLAAYKASEFKVEVESDKTEYVRGERAKFDVSAEYLFGAPMSNAPVTSRVSRATAYFQPPHSQAFVTSDEAGLVDHPETTAGAGELHVDEGLRLDDDGRLSTTVAMDLPRMRTPESVLYEAEAQDLTNQTIARRKSVLVHPAAFYVGIGRLATSFVSVGADLPAKIAAIAPSGAHVPGVRVSVELVQRTWMTVVEDAAGQQPHRRSRVVDTVMATCDALTTADVATCQLRVAQPGYYIVRARAKDAAGNQTGSSMSFYCVDDRADETVSTVAWADPDSRGLKLETDKKEYDAGEVAKILVRNPFKEAEALVTVERAGVLWSHVTPLKGPMPVVEVPVRSEYFPNAFVSVHVVRGRVQAPPESGADVGGPEFRAGIVPIHVNPDTHRLDVNVHTDKPEYRPGEDVDADVFVSVKDGKAPASEVTFYAVDEGVLMLTAYKTPDPLPPFTVDRSLAVFGLESRESLARLIAMKNGERVKPLGYEYFYEAGEDKGGDGGGGGDSTGGNGARADFKTTAFFQAGQVTAGEGNRGRAHYHFKLPDNLTTFRLIAVAAAGDRFGAGEAALTASKKLMARPSLPRVVRVGDTFDATVVVSAKGMGAVDADVTLAATGVRVLGPAKKHVTLAKGQSAEAHFSVHAELPGQASFDASVVGAGERDRVVVKRPVELPVAAKTVAAYGETATVAAIALGDLKGARTDAGSGGELETHLASTALVGLKTSFDRAIDYPYGCTEQLTSRVLPLLVLPEMAALYGVRMPAKVGDVVDDAVGQILTHQRSSGGFGFWEGGDDPAVPWLSAYAMLAVETAGKKGFFVPKDARDRGIDYLRRTLDQSKIAEDDSDEPSEAQVPPVDPDDEASPPGKDKKKERPYPTLAFVADVLATLGLPDPGYLNRLYDARAHQPLFSQALLLHAMSAARMPRPQIDILMKEIAGRVRVTDSAAYVDEPEGDYAELLDSSARTAALVLRGIVAASPDGTSPALPGRGQSQGSPLAERLAKGLLAHRVDGAWRSTQENVWALLALDDYRRAQEPTAPDFDARVFLGEERIGEVPFHGFSVVDQTVKADIARVVSTPGPLTFDVQGKGRLYYAAELRYATTDLPARATDRGFFVRKFTRTVAPEDLQAATKTLPARSEGASPASRLVLVDLLLESAEPEEQVVVDDPLPGGLEPVDFSLDTTAVGDHVFDGDPADERRSKTALGYGAFRAVPGMHREMHDDKVLTFLPHLDPGIYHFRYLARATTQGTFVLPPTRAQGMYSPEVWGETAATQFTVGAKVAPKAKPAGEGRAP